MNTQVWAITMVKNEQDIIGYNLAHLIAEGVDGIIVADNMSSDNTPHILSSIAQRAPIPVIVTQDLDPAHYQSRKMTNLAAMASTHFERGWIVPFDADELWYCFGGQSIAAALRDCPHPIVGVEMWNHFETNHDRCHPNPFVSMPWRSANRNGLDKVAYLYNPNLIIGEGNHIMLDQDKSPVPGDAINLGIRHFPYRGADHFVRKVDQGGRALAAATELPVSVGVHWRQYKESLDESGAEALKQHYMKYFYFADPETNGMIRDPAPYKGKACLE